MSLSLCSGISVESPAPPSLGQPFCAGFAQPLSCGIQVTGITQIHLINNIAILCYAPFLSISCLISAFQLLYIDVGNNLVNPKVFKLELKLIGGIFM